MNKTFEQRKKESAKAFAAFSVYLSMGPDRSLDAVGKKLGKCKRLIERWSKQHDWISRVQAQQAHLAVVEREATEAVARSKAAEWLARQVEIREKEWEMHEKCIEAAREGLKRFLENPNRRATLADIARMLETASKLGRLAAGMATEKTEITGEVDVNFRMEVEQAIKKVYGEVVDVNDQPGKEA
jgi:hypothetical protein